MYFSVHCTFSDVDSPCIQSANVWWKKHIEMMRKRVLFRIRNCVLLSAFIHFPNRTPFAFNYAIERTKERKTQKPTLRPESDVSDEIRVRGRYRWISSSRSRLAIVSLDFTNGMYKRRVYADRYQANSPRADLRLHLCRDSGAPDMHGTPKDREIANEHCSVRAHRLTRVWPAFRSHLGPRRIPRGARINSGARG